MRLPAPIVATILATLISALALPAVAGTLYRWVDEKGTVNYSSDPPPPAKGVKVQTLTQQPLPGYDGAAALAASERQNRELQARLDRLQREVEELKQTRVVVVVPPQVPAQAVPQQQAATNPCADDPRSNCSRGQSSEFDYLPVFRPWVVVGARPRPLPPFHVVPPGGPGKPVTLPSTLPASHKHHHSSKPAPAPAPGLHVHLRTGGAVRAH